MKNKTIKKLIAFTISYLNKYTSQTIDLASTGRIIYQRWLETEYRSRQQLSLYWAAWLPAIIENWPEKLGVDPTADDLHYRLKFWFCYTKRPDLFSQRTALVNGKKEAVMIPFSAGLAELKKADFNDYMEFVIGWTAENVGFDLKTLA